MKKIILAALIMSLMFTSGCGSVNKNIKGWFDAGAFAVGVGGYLTKGINFDNISLLEERAKKLINAIKY